MNLPQPVHARHTAARPDVLLISGLANRERVRRFAARRFYAAYGAWINDFLPNMLALLDRNHCLQASAGFQSAQDNRLYLEHYLDQPIEQAIAERLGIATPQRREILEVGNLASLSPGATRQLILNLACHFQSQGYKWLVITATPQIRNSFERLNVGLNLHRLCAADASAVAATRSDWGSYYDHGPEVYVGDIDAGIQVLRDNRVLNKLLERLRSPGSDADIRICDPITLLDNASLDNAALDNAGGLV